MMSEIIEFGQDPKEGMILIGFSTQAVIEGTELKSELIELLKQKKTGIRDAARLLQDKAMAPFEEAKRIAEEIAKDLRSGASVILKKNYGFTLNRVFWGYEKDMPLEDGRYFKLQVLDITDIEKYVSADKSFDVESFMKDNISEEEFAKLKKKKQYFKTEIIAPERKEEISNIDTEWYGRK